MRIEIVCKDAKVSTNTIGPHTIDGNIMMISDMNHSQIQDLFFEIWNKMGDDYLEKWLVLEGYNLIKA